MHLEEQKEQGRPNDLNKVNFKGEKKIDLDGDKLFEIAFGKSKFTVGGLKRYGAEACEEGMEWIPDLSQT